MATIEKRELNRKWSKKRNKKEYCFGSHDQRGGCLFLKSDHIKIQSTILFKQTQ